MGGMGVVHKAMHKKTGSLVALKTIKVAGEFELASIRREVRILARIRHPGVVKIVDHGVHKGLPWYAMELVEGVTLRHYFSDQHDYPQTQTEESGSARAKQDFWWTISLAESIGMDKIASNSHLIQAVNDPGGPVIGGVEGTRSREGQAELGQVLTLISRLCSPLAFLHGKGIVHRDLKPENIIVKKDGLPVLVDFGLMTQFTGGQSREILTIDQTVAGTLRYMAPEQIKGEFVDARADVYALGCILYELLVGHTPFSSNKREKLIKDHLSKTPLLPSHFRPEVPPELDKLVNRLLAKDPRKRIGHADVVATNLAAIIGETIVLEGPKHKAYLYRARCAGREHVLENLRLSTRRLKQRQGGFLLIGGESGVGKTRLMMEFGRELARQGVLVLTGECTEMAGRSLEVLLRPLQIIADRCRERGLKETESIIARRGKVLAMYEPAMKNLPGQESYPEPTELLPAAAKLRLDEV